MFTIVLTLFTCRTQLRALKIAALGVVSFCSPATLRSSQRATPSSQIAVLKLFERADGRCWTLAVVLPTRDPKLRSCTSLARRNHPDRVGLFRWRRDMPAVLRATIDSDRFEVFLDWSARAGAIRTTARRTARRAIGPRSLCPTAAPRPAALPRLPGSAERARFVRRRVFWSLPDVDSARKDRSQTISHSSAALPVILFSFSTTIGIEDCRVGVFGGCKFSCVAAAVGVSFARPAAVGGSELFVAIPSETPQDCGITSQAPIRSPPLVVSSTPDSPKTPSLATAQQ